ncbi:hypothetical protein TWF281_006832 [Arthrobotrys megalospora]
MLGTANDESVWDATEISIKFWLGMEFLRCMISVFPKVVIPEVGVEYADYGGGLEQRAAYVVFDYTNNQTSIAPAALSSTVEMVREIGESRTVVSKKGLLSQDTPARL